MDLHSIMNSDSGAGRAAKQPPQPPPPLAKAQSSSSAAAAAAPQTPIQAGPPPPHNFRDYSQSVHASPGQAPPRSPHEYGPSSAHPGHPPPGPLGPYASPTAYHQPPGAFSSRPAPPPLQPSGPNNDPRSPGSASVAGPSPYRHTPTSSLSGASGGYPFPAQAQNPLPPSPQQRHQYGPPSGYPRDPRDSYSTQAGPVPPPVGMPTAHGSVSYIQGQQATPQTPPVGTPGGGNHPYVQQQQHQQQQHQRSQSLQSSTSTPTSAHAQYGTPFGQQSVSPVATTHPHPHFDHHRDQRQSSQPPTPLGPPLSTAPRQSSVTPINYPQPPSPYAQRIHSFSSATAPPPPSPYAPHAQQQLHQQHSPPPPHPSSIPRAPSNSHSAPYDAISESHRRSQSLASQTRSERERSVSVSPKTRIPSLPSSAGGTAPGQRPSSIGGEASDLHQANSIQTPLPPNTIHIMDRAQREVTPAKRKLEDLNLNADELDGNIRRPPAPQLNGNHANQNHAPPAPPQPQSSSSITPTSASPVMPRRRRVRYANPPVWAQSGKGIQSNISRNYVLKAKSHSGGGSGSTAGLVNGNNHQPTNEGSVKSEHVSRHTSPEASRSVGAVAIKTEEPVASSTNNTIANVIDPKSDAWVMFEGRTFPIEPISLNRPLDFLSKSVADYLYLNVIDNQHLMEIQARGVQFEIEAKLGTIIDRDTNYRVQYPVTGECILAEEARVAFRSSMTETQHRSFNDWLNKQVVTSHPQSKANNPHVQIVYKHRREIDRFYELPASMNARLPHALQELQSSKGPLKARVTFDQKTGDVLAKIVKARVHDLHLHLPMSPLDCRISVNLEWDWDGPVEEITSNQLPNRDKVPDRNKDRLSYSQGHFQVDLTQVTQTTQRGTEKEHELEVEMNADVLVDHGQRLQKLAENRYPELVEAFVDNIRALARRCPLPA